jgi:ribosomal protein S18 acetylase RimI-like enzyme
MEGEPSGWALRTGEAGDLEALLELWRLAESRPSGTDNADAVRRLLATDPESLLIAEAEGSMVGSLIAGWDGWRGSFYRLAVHPGWRRRGLATALVRAGEERLEGLGAVRLTAIVAREESAAVALWESAGFSRQTDTTRFIRMADGSDS